MNSLAHVARGCFLFAAMALAGVAGHARDTGQVFVSSEKDNALVVIDAARAEVAGSVPLCKRPRHMQLGPDRARLFVACSDGNHIAVWDIASRKVVDKLDVGADPEMFDISPDGRMLYASNEEDSALTAYDLAARKKLFEVKVGGEPEGVKVSADGKTVYVTSEVASMVHVVDVASRKVVKNIAVGKRPRRFLLTPTQLWVSNELGASVSLIALADHSVQGTIDFKPPGMRAEDVTPVGMALSGDGKTAYVGLGRANHVAVVDVASRQVKAYVLVGKRAWGLGLSRDGRRLYVANGLSDDMTIVDTVTMKALKTVKAGRTPHSVVVDD
ncbi:MAG: beta-propeller repeat protein [Ramlibacter sp.]|nr:beta-propeller repeat protein [Ramlibacter sp.]